MKKQSLRTAIVTANNAGYQSIGSKIPSDMRRYVYFIKAINQFGGANELTIARGPAGSEAAGIVDYVQGTNQYDIWEYPEALPENTAPIYIFETVNEYIRVTTNNGDCKVFVIYADEP